ncbi:MAG: hypothetical protein ABEL97_01550 [Salinibacter sp.]
MMPPARKCLVLCFFAFAVAAISPPDATAQQWLQTTELIKNVRSDGPARALLDTLVQVIERRDSIKVRRTADASQALALSELRNQLINGPGLGLTSANKVFINYRFEIRNRGFEESIESFQFLFRPTGGNEEDIQMLYVDTSDPWVQDILRNKGTSLVTNEAALRTFKDQLSFARTVRDAQITEIAGNPVREGFEAKKRNLVQKIQRLTYGSM